MTGSPRSLVLAVTLVAACSSDPILVTPRAFDHPADLALVCFDSSVRDAVPLASCTGGSNPRLHALVIQSNRGEVATVDLHDDLILDSDSRVPGFTFVPVGELPTDILVPEADPRWTFVADAGSLDVRAIRTQRFFPGGGGGEERVALPSAPSALALSPAGDFLYVALPNAGVIARAPVDTQSEAPPVFTGPFVMLALGTDVPVGASAEPGLVYCKSCTGGTESVPGCDQLIDPFPTDDTGMSIAFPPRDPAFGGPVDQARPLDLEVDVEGSVLLVSDANLPIVHRFDLSTDPPTALPAFSVGAPTDDIELTPTVPDVVGESTEVARFLYAIDALERTILVADYATGAVLPVDVRTDRVADRIDLGAGARVLEILTPGFPGAACDPADLGAASNASPVSMRGVFAAVGTSNGLLHLIDVHDLDATCRGGDLACGSPSNPDDREVYIRRHRPRIGAEITDPLSTAGPPTLSQGDVVFPVEGDGFTDAEVVPTLAPPFAEGETCPPGMRDVFPATEGEDALVCALADPWAANGEQWLASFEGAIPGTGGGRGILDCSGIPTLRGEIPFCTRGVIGTEDGGTAGAEAAYSGDVLVITGALPRNRDGEARAGCEVDLGPDDDVSRLLDFRILRAFADRVELEPLSRTGTVTWTRMCECFPELVGYEVRSGDAWTVEGSVTGFLHRVIDDPAATDPETARCVVDSAMDARRFSRASAGSVYDNGIVRFQIRRREGQSFPVRGQENRLFFTLTDAAPRFSFDVGLLPEGFVFSAVDDHLYSIDVSRRGLLSIPLTPFDTREVDSFE